MLRITQQLSGSSTTHASFNRPQPGSAPNANVCAIRQEEVGCLEHVLQVPGRVEVMRLIQMIPLLQAGLVEDFQALGDCNRRRVTKIPFRGAGVEPVGCCQLLHRETGYWWLGLQPECPPDCFADGAGSFGDADRNGTDFDIDPDRGEQFSDDFSLRHGFVVGHEIGLARAAGGAMEFIQGFYMGQRRIFHEYRIDDFVRAGQRQGAATRFCSQPWQYVWIARAPDQVRA